METEKKTERFHRLERWLIHLAVGWLAANTAALLLTPMNWTKLDYANAVSLPLFCVIMAAAALISLAAEKCLGEKRYSVKVAAWLMICVYLLTAALTAA